MRVFSKQNDYYDSVQAYGQDQSLVYERKTEDLTFDFLVNSLNLEVGNIHYFGQSLASPLMRYLGHELPNPYRIGTGIRGNILGNAIHIWGRRLVVGFCGKWYPCLEVSKRKIRGSEDAHPAFKTRYYYPSNIDSLDEIADWLPEKSVERCLKRCRTFLSMNLLERVEPFHALQSPIIVMDVSDWGMRGFKAHEVVGQKDAVLADIQFYRQMDAFATFQSIEQFLSGVLGVGQPETVDISDRHRRDGKGFDDWSFKKRPKG